jgi:hypothetical protein
LHQEPVTRGLAATPTDWPWSSATSTELPLVKPTA